MRHPLPPGLERNARPRYLWQQTIRLANTSAVASLPGFDSPQYVLFVHGIDSDGQSNAQIAYMRLYWQGYTGRMGTFDYPTDPALIPVSVNGALVYKSPTFNVQTNDALNSAQALETLLIDLQNGTFAGIGIGEAFSGHVNVIAHSQGNLVVVEALRLWQAAGNGGKLIGAYYSIDAAYSADTFGQGQLPYSKYNWQNLYDHWGDGSPDSSSYFDKALIIDTTGYSLNLFNPDDYALVKAYYYNNKYKKGPWNQAGAVSLYPLHSSWPYIYVYGNNGTYIRRNWTTTDSPMFPIVPTGISVTLSPTTDGYEIFSFIAQSQGPAIGQQDMGNVIFSNNIDLQKDYGATKWNHDYPLEGTIAATFGIWKTIYSKLQ